MGLELAVALDSWPGWPVLLARLAAAGIDAPVKMVDGLPAFPGEVPEPDCAEIRLGLAAGMVTLRRAGDSVRLVVWGNADAGLLAARDAVAAALGAGD